MNFQSHQSYYNEVAETAAAMTVCEPVAIADSAQTGFTRWAVLGPNARRAALMKAADSLDARQKQSVAAKNGRE